MTIQEAIKSGRKFKRPGPDGTTDFSPNRTMTLDPSDILATDWEIEPEVYELNFNSSDGEIRPNKNWSELLRILRCGKQTKVTIEVLP